MIGGATGWWRGENNVLDSVGSGSGTLNGDSSYSIAQVGQGFVFDGVGDSVALGNSSLLGLNGSFTAAAWFNADSVTPRCKGFSEHSGAMGLPIHLGLRDNRLTLGFTSNDTTTTSTVNAGQWYHVAFRYDATTGEQAIYLNGALVVAEDGSCCEHPSGTFVSGV